MIVGVIGEESLLGLSLVLSAGIAEAIVATDATDVSNVIFATLVDDPANVQDNIDAYLGEIMLEAASAVDSVDSGIGFSANIDESASASDLPSSTVGLPGPPIILTGLIGWWDASVTASLSLSGSDINSVADQSGTGHDLTGVGTKPTYSATGFNSQPAFIFAGASSSGFLQNTSFTGPGATLTWFYVGRFSGSTAGGTTDARAMSYVAPAQGVDYGLNGTILYRPGTSNTTLNLYREGVVASGTVALTSNHRIIVTSNSSGATTIYLDGVSVATGTKILTVTTGGAFGLGAAAQNSNYWDGPIAEAGVATGYADATAVAALDNYLKTKWGL